MFLDSRGIYVWRRTNPRTGARLKRSTKTRILEDALKLCAQFEEELRLEIQGVKVARHSWRQPLIPLAKRWFAFLKYEKELTLRVRRQTRRELYRAFRDLRLKTAGDLDDVPAIHDRLMALERKGVSRYTLLRSYQHPLRRFTRWLAGNKRHLDRDPLATWEPVRVKRVGEEEREPEVFLPEEAARALAAGDQLDRIHGRKHPVRPAFLAFLTTAPRATALTSRKVEHFDPARPGIDYGRGVGRKRRGAGALDAKTAAEIRAYVGDRTKGPLFLAPMGGRLSKERLLDMWREAFGLGLVDALWPRDEPPSLELAYLVNLALLSKRVRVSFGGNPKLVRPETVATRQNLADRVQKLADRLRPNWEERMGTVTVKAFRSTLQTWSEAVGVPAAVVDKQLGHSSLRSTNRLETLKRIAGSAVGRKHYLSMECELLDASKAAEAVRQLLDEATMKISGSVLVNPDVAGRTDGLAHRLAHGGDAAVRQR